jgi:hypothetical protein
VCGAEVGEMNGMKQRGSSVETCREAKCNGTDDERMIEVNEPTASTLPSNNIMLYFFYAPLNGWVGAVVLRVGSVCKSTASTLFQSCCGVGYLT